MNESLTSDRWQCCQQLQYTNEEEAEDAEEAEGKRKNRSQLTAS